MSQLGSCTARIARNASRFETQRAQTMNSMAQKCFRSRGGFKKSYGSLATNKKVTLQEARQLLRSFCAAVSMVGVPWPLSRLESVCNKACDRNSELLNPCSRLGSQASNE